MVMLKVIRVLAVVTACTFLAVFVFKDGGPLSRVTSPETVPFYRFPRGGGDFILSPDRRSALTAVEENGYVGGFIQLGIVDMNTRLAITRRTYDSPDKADHDPTGLLILNQASWQSDGSATITLGIWTALNSHTCWKRIEVRPPGWRWSESDCPEPDGSASSNGERDLPANADTGPYLGHNVIWMGTPSWSRDRRLVAFNISERPEMLDGWHTDLRLIDGTTGRRLEQMSDLGLVGWLDDGSLLVRNGDYKQIRRIPARYFARQLGKSPPV